MKTRLLSALVCLVCVAVEAQVGPVQSNSLVRFRVSYGLVPVTDIEVELFDLDKPVTVSNFLYYAQSGAYSNSIFHRLVPNFVVEGGLGTVGSPNLPNAFSILRSVRTGPAITNEFFVGPRYTNTFGTLAMILGNGPNTARSSWFFNLSNNAAILDSQRYTVFGRLKPGSNPATLQWFNTFSEGNGIVNMTNTSFQAAGCSLPFLVPEANSPGTPLVLTGLPVGPASAACPRYQDLFHIEVDMVQAWDVLPPKVSVTAPKSNASLTNENVLVTGAASDNGSILQVLVSLNGSTALPASTNANGSWSITVSNAVPGTNTLLVTAFDTASNQTQVVRTFFRSARVPLTLAIDGLGTVSGATNGSLLEVGRGYTLTARPAKGQLFVDWSGSASSINPVLKFIMQSNFTLTATFVTNLFPHVQGTYNGLFYDTNQVQQASSGFLTVKVGNAGAYSGKILLNGKSLSLKGVLRPSGVGTNLVIRKGTNNLALQLSLDLTNGTEQLTGTISEETSTNTVWLAELAADRSIFNAKTNPAPLAGKYTLIFPLATNSPAEPGGDGFGAVTISPAGAVSFSGMLADGTKVTQKTAVSKNGQWPFYVALYKGRGSILSWVGFDTNQPQTDFTGLFNWFKQAQTAKYYAGGFTNEATLIGSRFTPPTPTNLVLNLTNGVAAFTNGNLAANFTNLFALDPKGKVFNQASNKMTLSISKSAGTFSGSVVPPTGGKAVAFKGALFQKQTNGAGFFLGTNESGRVTLEPR